MTSAVLTKRYLPVVQQHATQSCFCDVRDLFFGGRANQHLNTVFHTYSIYVLFSFFTGTYIKSSVQVVTVQSVGILDLNTGLAPDKHFIFYR